MYKLVVIFLIGMLGIWKAVPAGFLLKAPPLLVWVMTASGAMTSVTFLYFFGNWIKARFMRKNGRSTLRKKRRASAMLQRYGVVGLAVFGTITLGPNFTTIVGLILVREHKKLITWVIIGVLFWSAVLTVLAFLGLEVFSKFSIQRLFHNPAV